MLSVGELAVRRVSKFEAKAEASARGTKFNFRLTSRIQVSCCHRPCSPLCHTTYASSYLQLLLIVLSMCNTAVSVKSLQDRHGLPLLNQVVGWIIFGVSRSSQLHPLSAMCDCHLQQDSLLFSLLFRHSSSRLRGRPKGAYSPIFSPSARASLSFLLAPRVFSTCRIVRLCIFGP
jgi:hypothetical protein